MALDDIYNYFRHYDAKSFYVVACQGNEPSEADLAAFEASVGFRLPTEFRQFTMSPLGGLYIEVREELWPRPKGYDVGPFWSFLFGLKVLLRKEWIAAIALVAIFAIPRGLSSTYMAVEIPAQILVYAIAVLIVLRFGFVPLACAVFTINLMANVPFSSDFSAWYMPASIVALLSVVALAGWGFYNSLGGEPVWRPEIE